jgi:hypothetical protein
MNRELLLIGATFLESIPPQTPFNLMHWQTRRGLKFNGSFDCGFAGCAIGWMAHAKIFPRFEITGTGTPQYENKEGTLWGWDAVTELFDIQKPDAKWLFGIEAYEPANRSPAMVAERMRVLANTEDEVSL